MYENFCVHIHLASHTYIRTNLCIFTFMQTTTRPPTRLPKTQPLYVDSTHAHTHRPINLDGHNGIKCEMRKGNAE